MKKFLLLGVCLFCSVAVAQELFPELSNLGRGRGKPTEEVAPVPEETTTTVEEDLPAIEGGEEEAVEAETAVKEAQSATTEEDLFAPVEETPATEESAEEEAPEEEEEEEDGAAGKIVIYSDNVDSTIVPNRNFSYCFGQIKFYNGLQKPITRLSVTLTYGDLFTNFNIRNLGPKQTKEEKITLVGTACEVLMDVPQIDIKKCEVPEMEEVACKRRVTFVPLR